MAEHLKYLTDDNFESTTSQGVTLVDFYADWCGPCRMIAPIVEELSKEMAGKATIAKVDIENAPMTAQKSQVTSIPTIILYKNGKEMERIIGVRDKSALKKMIETHL